MRAEHVAGYLGKALLDARRSSRQTQAQASDTAGIATSTWSHLERGHGADVSLVVWARAARAVGADLRAYISGATATDQPRDAAHLLAQELIVRTAAIGGWRSHPERALDTDPSRSRAANIVLSRSTRSRAGRGLRLAPRRRRSVSRVGPQAGHGRGPDPRPCGSGSHGGDRSRLWALGTPGHAHEFGGWLPTIGRCSEPDSGARRSAGWPASPAAIVRCPLPRP